MLRQIIEVRPVPVSGVVAVHVEVAVAEEMPDNARLHPIPTLIALLVSLESSNSHRLTVGFRHPGLGLGSVQGVKYSIEASSSINTGVEMTRSHPTD